MIKKSPAKPLIARMDLVKYCETHNEASTDQGKKLNESAVPTCCQECSYWQNVPPIFDNQLGLNLSQYGFYHNSWIMQKAESQYVEIVGLYGKHQIIAPISVALSGAVLPIQILYTDMPTECYLYCIFPDHVDIWHIYAQLLGYCSTVRTIMCLISNITVTYVNAMTAQMELSTDQPAIVIHDVFTVTE